MFVGQGTSPFRVACWYRRVRFGRQGRCVAGDVEKVLRVEVADLVVDHRGDVLELDLGAGDRDRVWIGAVGFGVGKGPKDAEGSWGGVVVGDRVEVGGRSDRTAEPDGNGHAADHRERWKI